ncbi:endonuclease I family protein [Pseudoalteromonas sp. G4]|uniref:endonuclease I family protein n=1 Tax=Pseudoalteromonas sp. G4 TaxID=2992761 RepID=UPI00237DD7E4|nr:endonuclease [Pseudoalteromonas sp. G4]
MPKMWFALALVIFLTSFDLLSQTSICTNCPSLVKVKNRANFDAEDYYLSSYKVDKQNIKAFKHAVHKDINREFNNLSYKQVWTALTFTDEDPNNANNIRLIYKNTSIAKKNNGSGINSRQQDYWNREHIWPKSHGFPKKSQQGYTDLHHLKPADVSLNTKRSDNDFFEGGYPLKEAPNNKKNKSLWFEPNDGVKGDIARMIFYMDVMYEIDSHKDMPDLEVVSYYDTKRTDLTSEVGQLGDLCTLYRWHFADPIDAFEINRNDTIYEFQANRNPFIDHPEWVKIIYQSDCENN